MKKFTKKAVVALAPVLAVSMLAPAVAVSNVASAAEENSDVTAQVVYSQEGLLVKSTGSAKKIYVQELKTDGKAKGDAELYKLSELTAAKTDEFGDGKFIDLSEYTKKGGSLEVYSEKDTDKKVSITLNKQSTKVKAANKDGVIELTVDGATVSNDAIQWRGANTSWKNKNTDLTQFYKRGTTLYVRQAAEDSSVSAAKIEDGAPASKEAKLKIAKQAKAPKVTLDPVKNVIKFPKNCEVKCTEINGEAKEDFKFEALGTEKADKNPTLETFLTGKKLVSSVAISTTAGAIDKTSYSAIFEVRTAATEKKPASKIAEIKVPWQPTVKVGDTVSTTGISYDIALNSKKTQPKGIEITNNSEVAYQYAVVKATDDLSNVKWKKVAAGKTAKVSMKAAEKDSIVIYRSMGVKDNKKTDADEFAWASEIAKDTKVIAYPAEVKTDLAVTAAQGSAAGTTASKTAISVTAETGYDYYYEKVDKVFKSGALLEIGSTVPSGATKMTDGKSGDIDAKKDDVFAVYKVKDGVVLQAGSVKIADSNLK